MKISFLGPETTFTHIAAIKYFGEKNSFLPMKIIPEVFESVEKGETEFGVVPVENSTEGSVGHTLDSFFSSELKIVAEVVIPIRQCLISNSKRSEIKKVFSHSQALGQCRKYLLANFPTAELVETTSTASAAQRVLSEAANAAIASELAAKMFSLNIIEKGINDEKQNQTRFFVIGKKIANPTKKDKSTILFSTKNVPGALYNVIGIFAQHKVNMTKIESRPSKKKVWGVVFFVDFEGGFGDENITNMLEEMKEYCQLIKILGSYPEKMTISD